MPGIKDCDKKYSSKILGSHSEKDKEREPTIRL